VAVHEAQAYKEPGSPEEQSRRQFLANATLAVGGVIGLVLTVPLVSSLIPESLLSPDKSAGGVWADLPKNDVSSLTAKPGEPVKISFNFKYADGYLPPADDTQFVWAVKLTPDQEKSFKEKRPDLYGSPAEGIKYDAVTMSFVMFSSICPHLGCRYNWVAEQKRFVCPCHGSEFGVQGEKIAGPAPRGLDPLPFRDKNGQAQVTWIQYKSGQPDRLIVAYS
jgi:Rieske Fe-S protein